MNLKQYIKEGNGASDISGVFLNNEAFHALIDQLVEKAQTYDFTKIAAIEGKGLILGAAVAYALNKGLITVRSPQKIRSDKYTVSFIDYSKQTKELSLAKDIIEPGEKVLIVDDWLETGNTILAAIELIELSDAFITGILVFMDDSEEQTKQKLEKFNYKFLEHVDDMDQF